jgi:predicted RNA-binding Zn ribbon-like protein
VVSDDQYTSYQVADIPLPVPLAGHVALELCNTYAGWGEEEGHDYLASYEALAVWARERALIDEAAASVLLGARRDGREADRILARVRRLRGALYEVLAGEPTESAWALIAREARKAASAARLEPREDGGAVWTLPVNAELPLLAAARGVAEFLTAPERIGRCPGNHCGWLFVDPRGRRRWCTMEVCGNRAKARRHAARHAVRSR